MERERAYSSAVHTMPGGTVDIADDAAGRSGTRRPRRKEGTRYDRGDERVCGF